MTSPRLHLVVWLAAGLVAVSVGLTIRAIPQRLAHERDRSAPMREGVANQAAPSVKIETILALRPFGRAAAPLAQENVLETDLSLTLHGVVRAVRPSQSKAIVSSDGQPARSYLVGDVIAGGMRLIEVHSDHIIIENDDRRETLSFPHRRFPPPGLPSDVAPVADVTGDLDALRKLIFDQANSTAEPTGDDPASSNPSDESQ